MLEALSGVALPRGREITTRCPLVLRLINTADAKDGHAKKRGSDADGSAAQNGAPLALDSDPAPYAIISIVSPNAYDGERIDNLADVGARIEQVTAKLAGRGIGVVAEPIYLSVFRAHSPNLTLVDLPGITRNPVGDQPRDIYAQIKSMKVLLQGGPFHTWTKTRRPYAHPELAQSVTRRRHLRGQLGVELAYVGPNRFE